MHTLVKISWRNIWRNKRRSLVIMTAIALGICGGLFISAAYMGLMNQTIEESIQTQLSHIQVHHPAFIHDRELRHAIAGAGAIAESLRKNKEVKGVASRLVVDGMAASPHLSSGVSIRGVHPEEERQTTLFHQQVERGTYFLENGRLPSAVIGEALADDLQASPGSRIVLTFQDVHGEMISASLRVEGVFRATASAYEKNNVFVRARDLAELTGGDEAVTEIAVLLNDEKYIDKIRARLQQDHPELKIRSWTELAPDLEFVMDYTELSLVWIVAIILLGVSFGILNTILMSVLERTRELGVLLSIGMKKSRVFAMVILETVFLSLTGGAAGFASAYILIALLQDRGIDLTYIGGEALRDFGFSPILYPELDLGFYIKVTIMIILFAILAAIYPARKAVKLQPAEAVRK